MLVCPRVLKAVELPKQRDDVAIGATGLDGDDQAVDGVAVESECVDSGDWEDRFVEFWLSSS